MTRAIYKRNCLTELKVSGVRVHDGGVKLWQQRNLSREHSVVGLVGDFLNAYILAL